MRDSSVILEEATNKTHEEKFWAAMSKVVAADIMKVYVEYWKGEGDREWDEVLEEWADPDLREVIEDVAHNVSEYALSGDWMPEGPEEVEEALKKELLETYGPNWRIAWRRKKVERAQVALAAAQTLLREAEQAQ